ncbi:MAG: hypothetical protein KGQ46_07470 [Hyphomicrobiales bacterium]|nr:hypothetical protein [Hyphomicrobiales bacterium]MDE2114045.1 hypothetical protein [Hyphomicrobiales bacterium]
MSDDRDPDYEHQTTVNLIAVIVIMVLGAAILWFGFAITSNRATERCLESGRHDCGAKLGG